MANTMPVVQRNFWDTEILQLYCDTEAANWNSAARRDGCCWVMARTYTAEKYVTYAVTLHNIRGGVARGVLCGSASRLYDSTDRVQFS
jgi:hypothetical protein